MVGFMEGILTSLTALDFKHIDHYYRWLHHARVRKYIDARYVIGKKDMEESLKSGNENGSQYSFEVHSVVEGKLIGMGMVKKINNFDRNANLEVIIGELGYWNRGFGTEVCKLLTNFSFGDLNLHKLILSIPKSNIAALKVAENAGFALEAELKDEYFFDNTYINEMNYCLFFRDWDCRRNKKGDV
jgi:RimJ/RimL family protein N-acetyltransferase